MNEIQKPNDIFVANLNSPNASVVDLLQNNITANNTSLLTPEEYMQTPLIKKLYTKDGVFNQDAFNRDYTQAYQKFQALSDSEAEENLAQFLEYSPSDHFRPRDGKLADVSTQYTKLKNPQQMAIGLEGINSISKSSKTPEELAQSNYIFDPKTNKFTKDTPESLSLWKKINGQTLIYAKYMNDEIDPNTGQLLHRKGEFKTDANGNYYTEYLGNRDLGENEVVALQDILTKEDSSINKIDFFDSDDESKNPFGVAMKAAVTMAPYIIPYVGPYYAALQTAFGLASVMPTFYKSIEHVLCGDSNSLVSNAATQAENWFRKFEPSKSQQGRENFWNFETLGSLVSDTFSQLYQQRAAARAAEWFAKRPVLTNAIKSDPVKFATFNTELQDFYKKQNKLQTTFSLGYMGLVSTSDIYNESLKAGYDERTAGFAALISSAALFGIMNFNETTRGIGTWFLKNTTGYNKEVESGIIKKLAKEELATWEKDLLQFQKGNKEALKNSLYNYKRKLASKLQDVLVIGTENIWKNSIVEGVEEVTEEIVQDSVKGIIDTLSWLGVTSQKGSFGGWDNVFSKEGLERYTQTFLGGALGGSIFAGVQSIENRIQNPQMKNLDYTLQQAFIDGRYDEIISELKNSKKFFNQRLTANIINQDSNNPMYAAAKKGEKTQADLIYDLAYNHIQQLYVQTLRLTDGVKYDPTQYAVYQKLSDAYTKSNFDEIYTKAQWKQLINQITDLQTQIKNFDESVGNQEDLKKLQDQLKVKQSEFDEWASGKHFAENTVAALIYLNPKLRSRLLKIDIRSYAQDVLGVDYDHLTGDWTKEKVDKLYNQVTQELTEQNILSTLPKIIELVQKTMPVISQSIQAFVNNENNKLWLKSSGYFDENGNFQKSKLHLDSTSHETNNEGYTSENILEYLQTHPQYWSLSKKINFDLASALINDKAIDLSNFSSEEQSIVKELINDIAAHTNVNVWTVENTRHLLESVNNILSTRPEDNIFIKKLNEIQQTQSTNNLSNALVDIQVKGIDLSNITNISDQSVNVKLSSILDVIDDNDAFVDAELMNMLRSAFTAEQKEELQDQIKTLVEKLLPTLQQIDFTQPLQLKNITDSTITYTLEPLTSNFNSVTIDTVIDNRNLFTELYQKLTQLKGSDNKIYSAFESPALLEFTDATINQINIEDMIIDLEDVVNSINNYGILPTELQEKWNKIVLKESKENPLLALVRNLMHKAGETNDDLIDWLFNKESQIQNNYELFTLNEDELALLDDAANTIHFIYALIACTQESGTEDAGIELIDNLALPLSVNGVLRNAFTLYGDKNLANQYPVYSLTETNAAAQVLQNILQKLQIISDFNIEKLNNDRLADTNNEKLFNNKFAKLLSETQLQIANIEFNFSNPKISYDADLPDQEEYILNCLSEFHKQIADAINSDQITSEQVIDAIINRFNDNPFYLAKSIKDSIQNDLANSLIVEQLISAAFVDPKHLNELLIRGYEGESLYPSFDQKLALKALISKHLAKEDYALVQSKLYDLLQALPENPINEESFDKRKYLAAYLSRVDGSAGAGKTTIGRIYIKAIEPKNVLLTASTQDKVKDLKSAFKSLTNTNVIEPDTNKTIYDILGTTLSQISKEYESAVQRELAQDSKLLTTSGNRKISIPINGKTLLVEIVKNSQNQFEQIIIQNPEIISEFITDDIKSIFKDKCVIVDEATHLDTITTLILNELAKTSDIVLLGDQQQLKHTISTDLFGDIIDNSPFTHRTHSLAGQFRFHNNGKTSNIAFLSQLTSYWNNNDILRIYNPGSTAETDIIPKCQARPLKYKDLMGDEIVSDNNEFEQKVKQIIEKVNAGDSLLIICEPENIDTIKEKLLKLGLDKNILNSDIFKSVKNAQGAEATYSIIYDLKADVQNNMLSNGDIDVSKIYTAVTRSKNYSLIFDNESDGLFNTYGLHSIEDAYIQETSVNNEYDKNVLDQQLEKLKTLVKDLPTTQLQTQITLTTTDDDTQDTTYTLDQLNVNPWQESSKGLTAEQIDKNLELRKQLGTDFDDSVIVYTSYNRLGIDRDALNELKKKKTTDDVNIYLSNLWNNADSNEQAKDLLGFWNASNKNFISGNDLLNQFIQIKTNLIYNKINTVDDIGLNLKIKTNEDFWYLKPNTNEDLDETGNLLTTVIKQVTNGDKSYYITIARVGLNQQNDAIGALWSPTIQKLQTNQKKQSQITYFYKKKQDPTFSKNIRNKYYNQIRGINGKQDSIISGFISDFIPFTSIKEFKFNGNNKFNENLIEQEIKFNRLPLNKLTSLGFTYEPISFNSTDDFHSQFNKYRWNDTTNWDKINQLENKQWVIVHPIGNTNSAFSTLCIVQSPKNNNILQNLRSKNWNNTITPFKLKTIFSFLSYITNYPTSNFDNISTHLVDNKNGKQYTEDFRNQFSTKINEFIDYLKKPETIIPGIDNKNKLIEEIERLFNNDTGYLAYANPTHTKLKHIEISQLENTILKQILASKESEGFMFDFASIINDNSFITRCFENPDAYLNMQEFDTAQSEIVEDLSKKRVNVSDAGKSVQVIFFDTTTNKITDKSSFIQAYNNDDSNWNTFVDIYNNLDATTQTDIINQISQFNTNESDDIINSLTCN